MSEHVLSIPGWSWQCNRCSSENFRKFKPLDRGQKDVCTRCGLEAVIALAPENSKPIANSEDEVCDDNVCSYCQNRHSTICIDCRATVMYCRFVGRKLLTIKPSTQCDYHWHILPIHDRTSRCPKCGTYK